MNIKIESITNVLAVITENEVSLFRTLGKSVCLRLSTLSLQIKQPHFYCNSITQTSVRVRQEVGENIVLQRGDRVSTPWQREASIRPVY